MTKQKELRERITKVFYESEHNRKDCRGRSCPECYADRILALIKEAGYVKLADVSVFYERYISLLTEELAAVMPIATVHGFKSTRVEAGQKCREDIEKLKGMKLPDSNQVKE